MGVYQLAVSIEFKYLLRNVIVIHVHYNLVGFRCLGDVNPNSKHELGPREISDLVASNCKAGLFGSPSEALLFSQGALAIKDTKHVGRILANH